MGEAAKALTFGAHEVGKHLTDINPNYGSLRKREERDEPDKKPNEQIFVALGCKDHGNSGQSHGRTDRASQQQSPTTDTVNHGHCNHREDQVCKTDRNRLQIAGYLIEAGAVEDVV